MAEPGEAGSRSADALAGRRILVVGASSGIGAAIVRRGTAKGARLVGAARRSDALDAVVDGRPGALAIPLDVRDEDSVRRGVAAAAAALGGLDAVVYAAAVSPLLSMAEATAADWREVLDTNLVGCALVSVAAAPHLVDADGRLVVLSSKAVRQPLADLGLYATSKVALDGLLRCLPIELPGLRVTRVVVGNTHDTGFASSWSTERFESSLQRWLTQGTLETTNTMAPDDVADAVLAVLTTPVHIDDISLLEDPPRPSGPPGHPR